MPRRRSLRFTTRLPATARTPQSIPPRRAAAWAEEDRGWGPTAVAPAGTEGNNLLAPGQVDPFDGDHDAEHHRLEGVKDATADADDAG
jgi:hypothetical protein